MKNIKFYKTNEYEKSKYEQVSKNVFKKGNEYITSLSFEQESKYGEGERPEEISQYPLEDILDKYRVRVSNFYNALNKKSSNICYLEFASKNVENIKNLLGIVGKHVYNKKVEKGGNTYIELVVEDE